MRSPKQAVRGAAFMLAAAALLACAKPHFEFEFDEGEDLSSLRSFAWYPGLEATRAEERRRHPEHFAAAERGVEQALLASGHQKAPVDSADFLVSYTLSLEQRTSAVLIHDRYAMRGPDWELISPRFRQETIEYEKGTLVIDVIDPRQKRIVWRGSAAQSVYFGQLPDPATVETRATEILDRFPPNPRR